MNDVRESAKAREPFLLFARLAGATWAGFALFYLSQGRLHAAILNAVGSALCLTLAELGNRRFLTVHLATQLTLAGCLLTLSAETLIAGQGDSHVGWFMVVIALASGYLLGRQGIVLWVALTCSAQLLTRLSESAVKLVPEYTMRGWELTVGQVMLSLLCGGFAFLSRRTADERLRLVLQREQYIREQAKQLEQARDQAVAATMAKGRFLSTMSHEIRTPLYGILGAAQAIDADRLPTSDAENITTIVQSGELLLTVLNDILDSAKLDAGEMSLNNRPFDLRDNLEAACRLVRPLTEKKGLRLVCDIPDQLPTYWHGDEIRIRQIVLNLLTNACKFSSVGTITLRVGGISGALELSVSDQGAGISEKQQSKLFRPFQQLAEGDARLHGGTGLGLWIVRNLVHLMGGDVALASTIGQGSIFTITLPISGTEPPLQPAPSQPAPSNAVLRVLVVDDNPVNRKVTLNLLKRLGHNAHAVEGGAESVAVLGQTAYDVILMDLQMPEMDGVCATGKIRALTDITQPKIIAFSADVEAGKKLDYGAHAFDAFLGKPLRMQQLGDCLSSLKSS